MIIPLHASAALALLLIAMHVMGALVIIFIPIPWTVKIALISVLALSLIFYLRRYAFLNTHQAMVEIEMKPDCVCAVRNRGGEWCEGRLLNSTFVAAYMVVLNIVLYEKSRKLNVVIMPDAIDPEHFRNLRVLLKWKCGKALRQA